MHYLVSAGDFNIDMVGQSTSQQAMNTLILSNGFDSVITSPTRITENSATLLDLFVTNINRNTGSTGVLSDDISDHLPIFLFIKKFSSRVCRKQTVAVQDISESIALKALEMSCLIVTWTRLFR